MQIKSDFNIKLFAGQIICCFTLNMGGHALGTCFTYWLYKNYNPGNLVLVTDPHV